ncbi:MAG: D-aminoacylase, partial [Bacteroidia bacterium]|nr:D-aminoacylase [Bacteroidia bacterium]
MKLSSLINCIVLSILIFNCQEKTVYDTVIRNGTLIDGSGNSSFKGDLAIQNDSIVAIGDIGNAIGENEIDASGLVVAPGFINMLSWATISLIEDGRSMGDIKQGVTLEVFGEGWSMGPLNEDMKKQQMIAQGDIKFDIEWTKLSEYLKYLERKGVSPNIASFIGATTVRIHEVGMDDRPPTAEELDRMKAHVKQAMEEGALGVGSSLIYAPAFYSSTEELVELCKVASEYDGMYISHMRSEGSNILNSLGELIRIA